MPTSRPNYRRLNRLGEITWRLPYRKALYSPLNDPALIAWWHPNSGRWSDLARTTPSTPGGIVRAWSDAGPGGWHLTATASAEPTLGNTADTTLNGHAGTTIAPSAPMQAPLPLTGHNVTFWFVYVRQNTFTSNQFLAVARKNTGEGYETESWCVLFPAATQHGVAPPSLGNYVAAYVSTRPAATLTPIIAQLVRGPTTATVAVNGDASSGNHAGNALATTKINLGQYNTGASGTVAVLEFAIFQNQSATNADDYRDQLKTKYGIAF